MNEIKCPHCGGMFTIDEAGFAAILKQVRDAEFDKEVRRHEELLATEKQQAVQLAVAEALGKAQGDAAVKEARIAELEARLDAAARERENEARLAQAERERALADAVAATPGLSVSAVNGRQEIGRRSICFRQRYTRGILPLHS